MGKEHKQDHNRNPKTKPKPQQKTQPGHDQKPRHTGKGSIRKQEANIAGLRFVQWVHHDPREAAQADPPPEATSAVYMCIEEWLPVEDGDQDNILVLTQRSKVPRAFAAFASNPAGAQMWRQQSKLLELRQGTVLSFTANPASSVATPINQTLTRNATPRANVAFSRATDLTVLASQVQYRSQALSCTESAHHTYQ